MRMRIKRLCGAIGVATATLSLPLSACGDRAPAVGAEQAEAEFRAFLERFQDGNNRFINGDASLWKENASQRDDVTLFGGWGGHRRGWGDVGSHYDRVVSRFEPGGASMRVELLAMQVSGDLAYTVSIERGEVKVQGTPTAAPMALRVTNVFRRESGLWRLVHHHSDPLTSLTPPSSVLQQAR
jgi:ketosteroid isomerase-like protein